MQINDTSSEIYVAILMKLYFYIQCACMYTNMHVTQVCMRMCPCQYQLSFISAEMKHS